MDELRVRNNVTNYVHEDKWTGKLCEMKVSN